MLLLPFTVNTGDQLTLDSVAGAAWDGTEGSPLGVWRLAKNGDQFFAGLDVGLPVTMGGDPVPSANHMTIIAAIGTTPVYLALPLNTPATVPSVPANSQVAIQVNDSAIGDNQGELDTCVSVKNNAAATWSHTFDFTSLDGGWTPVVVASVPTAQYVPGVGWKTVDWAAAFNNYYRLIQIERSFSSSEITSIDATYDYTLGGFTVGANKGLSLTENSTEVFSQRIDAMVNGSLQHFGYTHDDAGITHLSLFIVASVFNTGGTPTYAGDATLPRIVVSGIGTDPF
jgi:hypothetical protein